MLIVYLLEGFLIGFLLDVPVGPIGVLCVRRTLTYGSIHGFIVGLSAASADIIYALVAAFGITLISDFVTGFQPWIRFGGGVLLLMLGFFIFRSKPTSQPISNQTKKHAGTFISTFLLALTNPMTLFAFAAIFTVLRTGHNADNRIFLPALIFGVFFGSLSWFALLTRLTHVFRKNITSTGLSIVNRIAGSLLMVFGVIAIVIGMNKF